MVIIDSLRDRERFVQLMRTVRAFGEDVSLQIDVTAEPKRLGYMDGTHYGKTFVENSSSKNACYYTHNTLRTLWKLAHYFPASRFRFEIPNRKHFTEYYDTADPLAPITYTSDYQFVAVMASNPLLWMEVPHLDEEDSTAVRKILSVWKAHREQMAAADICPIGEEPNGAALTGFLMTGEGCGYLLAFRAVTDREPFTCQLPDGVKDIQLLCASEKTNCSLENDRITVRFDGMRAYAFCSFSLA